MAGNNFFSHQKQNSVPLGNSTHNASIGSLISLERVQKLDLLIHLITNLKQSLILYGPSGIGKSTFLQVLQTKKPESWHVSFHSATNQSSFEQFQNELFILCKELNIHNDNLSNSLQLIQDTGQKVVLIIDNAGLLVPGLITSLCQFSISNPGLRIIFALTPDELHIKKSSDSMIEDCHFIDLPPLTENQCGEFLQNLSSKPGATISFAAINSALIDKIYRETHGIPGKIVDIQMGVASIKETNSRAWYFAPIAIILAAGAWVMFGKAEKSPGLPAEPVLEKTTRVEVDITPPTFTQPQQIVDQNVLNLESENQPKEYDTVEAKGSENPELQQSLDADVSQEASQTDQNPKAMKENTESYVEQIPEPAANAMPVIAELTASEGQETETIIAVDNKQVEKQQETIASKSVATEPLNNNSTILHEPVAEQKALQTFIEPEQQAAVALNKTENPESPKQTVEEKKEINAGSSEPNKTHPLSGIQWVLAQPQKNYTLQLLSVGSLRALKKEINEYPNLQKDLHFYQIRKKGKLYHVLLYGSYTSGKKASAAIKSLPAKYRKPWKRRFKTIQKEIRTNSP